MKNEKLKWSENPKFWLNISKTLISITFNHLDTLGHSDFLSRHYNGQHINRDTGVLCCRKHFAMGLVQVGWTRLDCGWWIVVILCLFRKQAKDTLFLFFNFCLFWLLTRRNINLIDVHNPLTSWLRAPAPRAQLIISPLPLHLRVVWGARDGNVVTQEEVKWQWVCKAWLQS